MSSVLPLDEEQRDALQELLNISMGQAANSLAQLIETKIDISIPTISAVTPNELYSLLFETTGAFYTRQSFLGDIHGEVMSVLSRSGLSEVAELMDYDEPLSKEDVQEIILELCNILAGACLAGLSEQLELTTNLNMPTLFVPDKTNFDALKWQHSLVMEVRFAIAISSFSMRVVFCLDDESLTRMKTTLDELLE
ncbi:chemotaxis protein CheX [Alteromonas sp. McT4-15]|jgi:chemotaxis protein CheC|uniref:chemotaxis protein CheX n=1 Tax=unclassified Alteromonas TaxID=2614992 RepID=UPI001924EDB4|nr:MULTISPECIES: chemotaxis protein CheX [unclassified Alteromonas]MEC8230313.1 chemotaxis protein CheX [Pseudomonadota bacterium]MCB4438360.1 chemotaxis protein CheX [Alteromonas sp. McT4-15]WDT85460.1 chemotaxis protein CheX [Alteromonas sp. 009811495]BCO20398.1 chemotaxis protein CheC [Alteromonas sp. KC3]BCO24364.1 chemotaxis protein CheC [Alteromonas sp. KC14]|tara:strand:- start:484 stop:1068 length:585 start_codon:yes stop_codon:yes gene_type:complete